MKMPDFLLAQPQAEPASDYFDLGETGYSFSRRDRPAATMEPWLSGDDIPHAARDVLQTCERFKEVTGLIRVPAESDAAGRVRAVWILGRASSGLLSLVVRDSADCTREQVLGDARCAIAQARRYCACSVVVLVQESRGSAATGGRTTLERAFETGHVDPDALYPSGLTSELPVWFASLSAQRAKS